MELTGKIKFINQTKEVGTSGFKKRDIVVSTDEQYPQHISVQFVQDKCEMLDKYKVGQDVTIGINLRGREWTNDKGEVQYFNTIQGWKITAIKDIEVKDADVVNSPTPSGGFLPGEQEKDDLPF